MSYAYFDDITPRQLASGAKTVATIEGLARDHAKLTNPSSSSQAESRALLVHALEVEIYNAGPEAAIIIEADDGLRTMIQSALGTQPWSDAREGSSAMAAMKPVRTPATAAEARDRRHVELAVLNWRTWLHSDGAIRSKAATNAGRHLAELSDEGTELILGDDSLLNIFTGFNAHAPEIREAFEARATEAAKHPTRVSLQVPTLVHELDGNFARVDGAVVAAAGAGIV